MRRMSRSTKAWCFLTGACACAGSLLIARILYGRLTRTWSGYTVTQNTEPSLNGSMTESDPEEIVYKLTFPDGSPVQEGELQKWLDCMRTDPDVTDDELVTAIGIVKQLRAQLN
jgi:hypothetical protein